MNRKDRLAAKSKGQLSNPALQGLFNQALQQHQAGQLQNAGQLYRQILALEPRHADSLHFLGLIAYQLGNYDDAVEMMNKAMRINGKNSAHHNNLGLAYQKQGKLSEAIASYKRALALAPDDAEVLNNMGVTLELQGRFSEAIASYAKALGLVPDYTNAHYNMGNVYRKQGFYDDAEASYLRALEIKPDYIEAHNNLAATLKDNNKLVEATRRCELALSLKPDDVEALVTLGTIFKELEKPDEALKYYERAIALKPDYAEAYNNRGLALNDLKRFDEALAAYERALALMPDHAAFLSNMGSTLEEMGRSEEADAMFKRALAINPDSAETYYSLGYAARRQGRLDDAVAFYDRATSLKKNYAEAHWNQAFISLLKGDLKTGWAKSEWRWHRKNMKPHGYDGALWDGGGLEGKSILIHSEQGLGDSIQFIRYAPLVKAKGGTVYLSCPAALQKLLSTAEGIDGIFPDGLNLPAYDVQSPLLTLPGLLGTTLETIPAQVPYLRPDATRVGFWQNRLAALPGRKVGIVWRGNPQHKNDRNRSMTPAQYAAFLNVPGISVVNLQKDAREEEIQALGVTGAFLNAGPELGDFSDTAALLTCLDLVISVDTSICHLAGALNVPTWTLIPFAPDWRWLLGRSDTPWYPSMRLFRQERPGDWRPVIDAVKNCLAG